MKNFIDFVNVRYSKILFDKDLPSFIYWDDYALFLFEDICNKDEDKYYELLEQDIKIYSDIQTGSEREAEKCREKRI